MQLSKISTAEKMATVQEITCHENIRMPGFGWFTRKRRIMRKVMVPRSMRAAEFAALSEWEVMLEVVEVGGWGWWWWFKFGKSRNETPTQNETSE